MKALSIQQPWAFLIVNGLKDIENRDWSTTFRGLIYVHAGKTLDTEGYAYVQRTFPAIALPPFAQLERGGLVGQVRIVGCVEASDSRWFFGRYGFVLREGSRSRFGRWLDSWASLTCLPAVIPTRDLGSCA